MAAEDNDRLHAELDRQLAEVRTACDGLATRSGLLFAALAAVAAVLAPRINPAHHEMTISGTVAEYNANSNTFATVENAAIVATDAGGNDFVVECDSSKLGNVQSGQTFTAKVTVVGVVNAENTVYGGTGVPPDFEASTFTVTG